MKELYRRMNDSIHADPALVTRTVNAAAGSTRKASAGQTRHLRFIPAMALILALLVATPALAAGSEDFNALLYRIAPDIAMYFRPVNRSTTRSGVTMEVLAVDVDNMAATLYLSIQGEAVNENTDLFDSYHFDTLTCAARHTQKLSYDEATHTAVFRVNYAQFHGDSLDVGGKMTFTVERLLLDRTVTDKPVQSFEIITAPATTILAGESLVLKPGTHEIPLAEGISITASGSVNGMYRIQTRRDASGAANDAMLWIEGDLFFGRRLENIYPISSVSFNLPEDGPDVLYTDHIFAQQTTPIIGKQLFCTATETVKTLDGPWSVTFPLENYEAP